MTKIERRQYVYNRYKRATYTSVNEYYKSCSDIKQVAERAIKHEMIDNKGTRYRVTGGSCHTFTCAYSYHKDGKWYLRYHTKSGYTDYELTEEEVNELYLQ